MTVTGLLILSLGIGLVAYGARPWVGEWAKRQSTDYGEVNKARFLAVLALGIFATLTAVQIVPPLLVEIASDFEISVAVAGQLATATFATWGVSVVSVGPLSDSFGRRPIALGGLLLLSVAVVASAFAPNIETLLALRALTGLAGGTLLPNAVAVLSDVISLARRAQAVSALLAMTAVTTAISAPMVAVLADLGGWRFVFVVSGLLLALGFLMNWLWFPRDNRERVRNFAFFSRYWPLLSRRFFRVAIPVSVLQRSAFWGFVSFSPAYMIYTYQVSVGFVALPLAISAAGQLIGNYSSAFVTTSRHRAVLIGITTAAGGSCGFLFFAVDLELWVAVSVATVGMGLLAVTIPVLLAAGTEYSGESRATGAGLMGLSNQGGGMLGAAMAGTLLANVGYEGIGYMCLGVTIASALMTSLFGRQFGEDARRPAN